MDDFSVKQAYISIWKFLFKMLTLYTLLILFSLLFYFSLAL